MASPWPGSGQAGGFCPATCSSHQRRLQPQVVRTSKEEMALALVAMRPWPDVAGISGASELHPRPPSAVSTTHRRQAFSTLSIDSRSFASDRPEPEGLVVGMECEEPLSLIGQLHAQVVDSCCLPPRWRSRPLLRSCGSTSRTSVTFTTRHFASTITSPPMRRALLLWVATHLGLLSRCGAALAAVS